MPDGNTHGIATLVGIPVASVIAYKMGMPPVQVACVAAGYTSTLWVNPDLDLNTQFPRNTIRRWVWWFYWWPYSRAVPHRHWTSHLPVVGTVLRALYVIAPAMIIGLSYEVSIESMLKYFSVLLPFVIGAAASDTVHSVMDYLSTHIKRKKRQFRRKRTKKR